MPSVQNYSINVIVSDQKYHSKCLCLCGRAVIFRIRQKYKKMAFLSLKYHFQSQQFKCLAFFSTCNIFFIKHVPLRSYSQRILVEIKFIVQLQGVKC